MKLIKLICAIAISLFAMSQVIAATMTFDDAPTEVELGHYYAPVNGISWGRGFYAAEHTESSWWQPHSGNNVLAWRYPGGGSDPKMEFRKYPAHDSKYAYSVNGYFSTEYGVVLQMVGLNDMNNPITPVLQIGAIGQAWNNIPVQINSPAGEIRAVEFIPVTTDALSHFCADDITVNFVPEPSSLLALFTGLAGIGGVAWRRRI